MKKTHIVALVIIAISVGVIIAMSSDYSSYESFSVAKSNPGKELHVVGNLIKQDQMQYNPLIDVNYFSFYLKDKEGEESKVVFKGTKPQDFEKSEQIVLTGKMTADYFEASQILMKCPSKYVENELAVSTAKAADS